MCQIVPFTLPCCRRVYVAATKVPSCPDDWPKRKCPPELCLQICYEAEHRETGKCWRCKAEDAGVSEEQRERLRPGIDNAEVVVGLEELRPGDRRKSAEDNRHCWFCGSQEDCESCGQDEGSGLSVEEAQLLGKKRKTLAKTKPVNKRLKIEGKRGRPRKVKTAILSTRPEAHWQAQTPQDYKGYHGASGHTDLKTPIANSLNNEPHSRGSSTLGTYNYTPMHATGAFGSKIDPKLLGLTTSSIPKFEDFQPPKLGNSLQGFQQCNMQVGNRDTEKQPLGWNTPTLAGMSQPSYIPVTGSKQDAIATPTGDDDLAFGRMLDSYNRELDNPSHQYQTPSYSYPSP